MIPDGGGVGLGTGRAATAFIHVLGEKVRAGLKVRGVPTSQASADLARQLGIPLASLDDVEAIDVDVDGADEVAPDGDLIKGYGGALVRERIVADASGRVVILVGPEKLVPVLGSRGKLPVEVLPFAAGLCRRRLLAAGFTSEIRAPGGQTFVTDNGNWILDCRIAPLENPRETEQTIRSLPGVVGTGMFLGVAHAILIQRGDTVEVRPHPGTH
jgi:ribose 5-phosphate isomerase A